MKYRITKEQRNWGITAFAVIACSAVFIMLLVNWSVASAFVKKILKLFVPFYIGFVIAYLLNPVIKFWEDKIFRKIKKPQVRRMLALVVTYLLFVLVVGGALAYLVPQLITSITNLVNGVPTYYKTLTATVNRILENHPGINEFYSNYSTEIDDFIKRTIDWITDYLSALLPRVAAATLQVGTGLLNFFIGIIISIYFLAGKEKIVAQSKKMLNVVFKKEESYQRVLTVGNVTHEKTLHFIIARLVDSLIVAILAYIIMTIFGFPYALLNALIIGVFNTIPYFGAWIGAVPPAIIMLIVKPSMFIPYLIFIILLQQLDGNLIGPKIQGKQLGLSALWIMFAIFLFGGLFGFFGMVVGVPFFAVIYYFVNAAMNNRLNKQGKSANTADYAAPEDRELIEAEEKS